MEAGKRRLAGDTARATTTGAVQDLRWEACARPDVLPTLDDLHGHIFLTPNIAIRSRFGPIPNGLSVNPIPRFCELRIWS